VRTDVEIVGGLLGHGKGQNTMGLAKDRKGRVIGFERLNFLSAKQRKDGVTVPLEVHMV
jgi:hypothetical protein